MNTYKHGGVGVGTSARAKAAADHRGSGLPFCPEGIPGDDAGDHRSPPSSSKPGFGSSTKFLSRYIEDRISQGAFRTVDPLLAARNFVGMVIHYLLIHELFGVERASGHSTKKAVETFVSLFLGGIRQIPNSREDKLS